MDQTSLYSFAVFVSIAAFTPGPNNLMLAASGVNFGFRRTLAHMAGITVGFGSLVIACAFGLGSLFTLFPDLLFILKIAAIGFLIYLAWKIASAGPAHIAKDAKPISFMTAFAFQWVNPKAVIVSVSGMTAYLNTEHGILAGLVPLFLIYVLFTALSVMTWAYFGTLIGRLLASERAYRLFNSVMAGLLVASLLPVIIG